MDQIIVQGVGDVSPDPMDADQALLEAKRRWGEKSFAMKLGGVGSGHRFTVGIEGAAPYGVSHNSFEEAFQLATQNGH